MEGPPQLPQPLGRLKLVLATLASGLAVLVVAVSIASGQPGPGVASVHRTGVESCPARDASAASGNVTLSSRPGASHALVPQTPTAVLLCRYTGLTEPAPLSIPAPEFTLEAHDLVTSAAQTSALAAGLDAIRPSKLRIFSCPADFDQEVVAWFTYGSGAPDPVTLEVNGCNAVTNGIVHRLAVGGSAVSKPMALVPAPRPAQAQVQLELCGGPAPGGCRVSPVTNCAPQPEGCVSDDRVAVIDSAGDKVVTLHLHAGRGGPVELIPGHYTFQLLGAAGGNLPQTRHVTLGPGSSTSIVLTIDAP